MGIDKEKVGRCSAGDANVMLGVQALKTPVSSPVTELRSLPRPPPQDSSPVNDVQIDP